MTTLYNFIMKGQLESLPNYQYVSKTAIKEERGKHLVLVMLHVKKSILRQMPITGFVCIIWFFSYVGTGLPGLNQY